MAELTIPNPPGSLPDAVQEKWKKAYAAAFAQAKNDEPDGPESAWRHVANREANKVLRFIDPSNYDEAMALEDWQVIRREEQKTASGVVLKVVTRHGRGFSFPVPPKKATAKNGNGADDKSKP